MNRKLFIILSVFLNFSIVIQNINCNENITETNVLNQNKAVFVEQLIQMNDTNDEREGKQNGLLDIISGAIGAAAAGAVDAASSSMVAGVLGNELIYTGEYCGSRRSSRYCDNYCHDIYRGPMEGWCRNGLCVCECDRIRCDRYCSRYWDHDYDNDYDYDDHYDYDSDYVRRRRPYARQTFRGRGYCSSRGCRCD